MPKERDMILKTATLAQKLNKAYQKDKIGRSDFDRFKKQIQILTTEKRLNHINNIERNFGEDFDEQVFNVALELNIMWINRILFLKLLEAQLVQYNNGSNKFEFLNTSAISDFDELNELFFEVLAKKSNERNSHLSRKFGFIPYLNSSLFEISKLEDDTIRINSLKSRLKMPVSTSSVLVANKELTVLEYLFDFLNAYDFTSEGIGKIQEENKNLINASVLGLIFEKINGYKEGSFFTPGYITMYMCRENIRKAVIQKFIEAGFNLSVSNELSDSFMKLKDLIDDRKQANQLINSLKICDPAVGSGHFLVSALNEIIALKSDLGILEYRNGNRIKNYKIEVANDELIVTDKETEELFEYTLSEKGNPIDYKQDLQEALFHEKQSIIENCLFGIDINPNSVNICRLRLWIELLKNSYYHPVEMLQATSLQLQTLPNLDINIKQGNSLVGRFPLNGNGIANGQAQKMKLATRKYKEQVFLYKSTDDKKVKENAEREIQNIKQLFAKNVNPTDNDYIALRQKQAELAQKPMLFSPDDVEEWRKKTEQLAIEVSGLEKKYNEKLETLYAKAFEWRFEFPEVLDDNGNFVGFDVVIGNPPYISFQSNILSDKETDFFANNYKCVYKIYDTFALFIEKGMEVTKKTGLLSYICPSVLLMNNSFMKLREYMATDSNILSITNCGAGVFDKAVVPTIIFSLIKNKSNLPVMVNSIDNERFHSLSQIDYTSFKLSAESGFNLLLTPEKTKILNKFHNLETLHSFLEIRETIKTGNDKAFISDRKRKSYHPVITGKDMNRYIINQKRYINFNEKKLSRPTKLAYYQQAKLFIRRVGADICAAFDSDNLLSTHVLYIGLLKSDKVELKYLLALLNSKLLNWIYNIKYPKKGNVFPKIRIGNLRTLPIFVANIEEQRKIIELVDKIMEQKKKGEKTLKPEKQIDNLVYKLYDIQKSEIKEIETEQEN